MILAQHCRNCHYILLHAFKFRNNQVSGIFFVSRVNLFLRQTSHTGDFSVEIIRMSRTITGNTSSGLCPARCIGRMGMYNSTYFRKRLIQFQMGRCIGGWLIPSFHTVSFKIHNHHIFRLHNFIIHTTWLNHKISGFTVNSTHITPGKCYQTIFWKKHICFVYLLF